MRILIDASVILLLAAWTVLGPLPDPHPWMQPFHEISSSPFWLRAPGALLGAASWFVITRSLLPAILPRRASSTRLHLVAAVALLGWWLPFNVTWAPEPLIALGSTLAFVLLLKKSPSAHVVRPFIVAIALLLLMSFGDWHVHYEELLRDDLGGTSTKRLAVGVCLVLLVVVGLLLARGVGRIKGLEQVHLLAYGVLAQFALLTVVPDKGRDDFGAVAGLGVPFVAVAVVTVAVASRRMADDAGVRIIGAAGGGLLALVVAMSFAGRNVWPHQSGYGVPWADGPLLPLALPPLWLFPVLALLPRRRWRALAAAPAIVAVSGLATVVLVLLASFVMAPIRQADSYSVGAENIAHLTASSCGLADKVQVIPTVRRLIPERGEAQAHGFVTRGGLPTGWRVPGGGYWGSLAPDEPVTGEMTTPWYPLPALRPRQELAVSVAGRTDGANAVRFEFPGGTRTPSRTASAQSSWRSLSLPAAEIPPGAGRVRIHAVDASADEGGWLAVSAPRVVRVTTLNTFLSRFRSVQIEPRLTTVFPCARHDGPAKATIHADAESVQGEEIPSRLINRPGTSWGAISVGRIDR